MNQKLYVTHTPNLAVAHKHIHTLPTVANGHSLINILTVNTFYLLLYIFYPVAAIDVYFCTIVYCSS